MKKTIALIMLLCVSAVLFASVGITVRAGGTFGFAYTKVPEDETLYKVHGFGFDGSVMYDITDKFAVYADFNMLFPKDLVCAYIGEQEFKISERVKELISGDDPYYDDGSYGVDYYSISAGAAYKLDLGIPVRLAIGAGISVNHLKAFTLLHEKESDDNIRSVVKTYNIGLNAIFDANYMIDDDIGVGLTVIPQVGLYNITRIENSRNDVIDEKFSGSVKGFTVSFAMPITVGVSYSF